jgi:hypothetical protein
MNVIARLTMSTPIAAIGDRSTEAASIFNDYCLEQPIDLAAIDKRASAEKYEVVVDREIPLPGGNVMRQKNWLIPSKNGPPTMLISMYTPNGSLIVRGCGIYGPDLDASAMESALSQLPRMGVPTKHTQAEGTSKIVWWSARVGGLAASEDSQVMMAGGVRDMPGVQVNLIFKTPVTK